MAGLRRSDRLLLATFATLALLGAATPAAAAAPTPSPSPTPSPTAPEPVASPSPSSSPTPSVSPPSSPGPTRSPGPTASPSPGSPGSPSPPSARTAATPTAGLSSDERSRQAKLDSLRGRLNSNLAEALAAQERLTRTIQDNDRQQQQILGAVAAKQKEVNRLIDEVHALDAGIAQNQRRVEIEQTELAVMARAMYSMPDSILLVAAQAGSLFDALVNLQDYTVASIRLREMRQTLTQDRAKLDRQRADQRADLDRQTQLLSGLSDDLKRLDALKADELKSSRELLQQIDNTKALIAALSTQPGNVSADVIRLQQEQQLALIQQAEDHAWQQFQIEQSTLASTVRSSGLPLQFVWPVTGARVTQPFGPTDLWWEPIRNGVPFHEGVDLAAPYGTPIHATADGVAVVVQASYWGYGNYVIIAHGNGIASLYGHLDHFAPGLKPGTPVSQGQVIGYEGTTGASTGPHLHFEMRLNGQPTNPANYLPGPAPPAG